MVEVGTNKYGDRTNRKKTTYLLQREVKGFEKSHRSSTHHAQCMTVCTYVVERLPFMLSKVS